MFELWRRVSINRLLPVRPPHLFRFAPLKLAHPPRTLTSTTPHATTTDSPTPSPTDDKDTDGDYDRLSVRSVSAIIAGVVGGTFFVLLTSLGTFAWKRMFALS